MADYPIFRSQYSAQQIEDEITNAVPKVVDGYWYRWDVAAQEWVNTGVTADSAQAAADAQAAASDAANSAVTAENASNSAARAAGDAQVFSSQAANSAQAAAASAAQTDVNTGELGRIALAAFATETAASGAAVASFDDGADGVPVKALTVNIAPYQEGSGDPSPTNIRPIHGWTGANIFAAGKNLIGAIPATKTDGGVTFTVNADGSVTIDGTDTERRFVNVNFAASTVTLPRNSTLTVSGGAPGVQIYVVQTTYSNPDAHLLAAATEATPSVQFTVGDDVTALWVRVYTVAGESYDNLTVYPSVVVGSEAPAAFETGAVTKSALDWSESAGTVYGGTLSDNGDGTWLLRIDSIGQILTGDEAWQAVGEGSSLFFFIFNRFFNSSSSLPRGCSHYVNATVITSNTTPGYYAYTSSAQSEWARLQFRPLPEQGIETIAGWKSYLAAQYANGTPVFCWYTIRKVTDDSFVREYTISGAQVRSLLGDNTIWSDAGTVDVTIRADPTLYINKRVAALTAIASES